MIRILQRAATATAALLMLSNFAFAQSLTTIQDTLFMADGTRFNGSLVIQWNTFDASNLGTVIQQSKTVTVANGNLLVQLAVNQNAPAPANTYTVSYQSDGRAQYTELWSVPASATPLPVASVRIGTVAASTTGSTGSTGTTGTGSGSGTSSPIPESQVTGLPADLAQRPIKGPGFGTSAVAVINADGQVETVVGNLGDCVYVDGTTGPCGGGIPTFVDAETPGGTIDGVNNTFTLANTPSGTSLALFLNGLYMTAGADYTLTGSTITFVAASNPQPGDILTANYRVDPAGSNSSIAGHTNASGTGTSASRLTSNLAQVICSNSGRSTGATTFTSLGSCDVPSNALHAGDRIEVRFSFAHTGTGSGYDVQLNWGSTTVIARHGGTQDAALTGQAEAAITATGAQISVQSWGTVLTFLPGIVNSPAQSGVKVDLRAQLSKTGSDQVTLTNVTVLRYPGN